MTEHKRQPGRVKLGVPNVQVGAADAARDDPYQDLARPWLWDRQISFSKSGC
jgi:hypothetical protein